MAPMAPGLAPLPTLIKIGFLLGDGGSWDSRLLRGCIPSAVLSLEQVQELFVEWMMEKGKEGRSAGGAGEGGVGR